MPKAVYHGSAARYIIGPHTFLRMPEGADPAEHGLEVDENIAKLLDANPEFSIDGKGYTPEAAAGADIADAAVIPAEGFKSREAARVFATKWLPEEAVTAIDFNRSTPEIARRIQAALDGVVLDKEGNVVPAAVDKDKGKAKATGKKVAV